METYLGIDGGGSKTRALLVDADGKKIHYAESGPSNLNAQSDDIVRASICAVVQLSIEASGSKPSATCFGIAGASSTEARAKLDAIIQPLALGKTEITTDAAVALEGAFLGGPGILLIAGTGSICLGKSIVGAIHRTGGWGWLADDVGSAAWIGQRGLEVALQQNDGRLQGTELRDALFTELEINFDDEINSKLYHPPLSRSKLAEFAPCVLGLAKDGIVVAQGIQQQALDELEKLIRATESKLNDKVHEVALAGGLLAHNSDFLKALESRLTGFNIHESYATPLEGAVALARKI